MPENAKFKFFDISKCGYFERGSDVPNLSGIADTLGDLRNWTTGKLVSRTSTYSPDENNENEILRTFCYGIHYEQGTGDYLLATWNETPATNDKFVALNLADQVGHPTVQEATIEEGYVPGYATYFWFIPERSVLATVQFNHQVNGRKNLEAYLQGFLDKYSRFVHRRTAEDAIEVLGYGQPGRDFREDLKPYFRSGPIKNPGKLEYIRQHRPEIVKVIRKDMFTSVSAEKLNAWESLFAVLGQRTRILRGQRKVKFEIEHTPSEAELNAFIESFSEERGPGSFNLDTGFAFRGDSQKPFWLSYSLVSDDRDLNVTRENAEVFNCEMLLREITNIRPELLRLLDQND